MERDAYGTCADCGFDERVCPPISLHERTGKRLCGECADLSDEAWLERLGVLIEEEVAL